jgi:hypothetical protein
MHALTLLLPRLSSLAGVAAGALPILERIAARAARTAAVEDCEHPVLSQLFALPRRPWSWAAITRMAEADAPGDGLWVRADPAHVRPDIAGARLLAVGELGLSVEAASTLCRALAPLFGDLGMQLSAPHPDRWYLRLPDGAPTPLLAPPWRALGEDLRAHLPQGPDAARWRRLQSEAQILLHSHPLNAERAAAGLPAVNSLWFWGAGVRPLRVEARIDRLASEDPLLRALAGAAGIAVDRTVLADAAGRVLVDLRPLRDARLLESQWIAPAWDGLRRGRIGGLQVLFADGAAWALSRAAAFAFWRRPVGLER